MTHSINKFQNLEFKGNILKVVTCSVSNIIYSGTLTVALCVNFKITLFFVWLNTLMLSGIATWACTKNLQEAFHSCDWMAAKI